MRPREQLLALADAYCGATGRSPARVATLAANHGGFFKRIEGGGGFTTDTFERVVRWFADHWLADLAWPDGVARPARTALIGDGERRVPAPAGEAA